MSGFLPDLASWALRGGAGSNGNGGDEDANDNDNDNDNDNEQQSQEPTQHQQLSEQDMRARRLARMEAMAQKSSQQQQQEPEAMEVDPKQESSNKATPTPTTSTSSANSSSITAAPMEVSSSSSPPRKKAVVVVTNKSAPAAEPSSPQKSPKKKKESHENDSSKLQKKKELLIKKVIHVTIAPATDSACVPIELDSNSIGTHSIAELLATRLSLPCSCLNTTMPPQKPLIPYLALAHRKAADELSTLRHSKKPDSDIQELLEEIQRQVVSYAASSLMEPDLFEQAKDAKQQLSKELIQNTDPTNAITFGLSGPSSSFYYLLCEELVTQDQETFEKVVTHIGTQIKTQLSKCDTLDSGGGEATALGLVSALTSLCVHKKAALALSQHPQFLLPPAGSPAATEQVRPPVAPGTDLIRSMFGGENQPYLRRSGRGLEKDTILGLCLRVSTPKNNPAFSPNNILRQSLDSVERTTNSQRRQLLIYQDACNRLIMALIKGGPDARGNVLHWIQDCLLVNTGATAMRPDATKVSSTSLLLNVSVALLKLCEPFVMDEKKHKLIDAGFVSSAEHHGGIFPISGDNALPRLGESNNNNNNDDDGGDGMRMNEEYNPKNAFIPTCFFFTVRSLALGILPMLSHHENLLRHISHQHWQLSSQHRDIHSDPHFCILVSKQRSNEVALFEEEMAKASLGFCNLIAKFLHQLPDDILRTMPEHFVDNICDVLMGVAKMKPKLLRGMELRYVFALVIKLLSPTYASVSTVFVSTNIYIYIYMRLLCL